MSGKTTITTYNIRSPDLEDIVFEARRSETIVGEEMKYGDRDSKLE